MLNKINNSSYTISVDLLVNSINGDNQESPSLFQQAADYFKNAPINAAKLTSLTNQVVKLKQDIDELPSSQGKSKRLEILDLAKQIKSHRLTQKTQRLQRLQNAINVCTNIIALTEGADFEETQLKSAKFLATLALLSPGTGKQLAELHQTLKPAYKAVLSIRLLDKLISSGIAKNGYILAYYNQDKRYQIESCDQICFTQSVLVPVMLAALFQDVGLQHPELTELLEGKCGDKDRFRLLEKDDREEMLRLNYQYTIDYLKLGLGCQQGKAESEELRLAYAESEQKRLKFQLGLVEDANSTKLGTSEIIKVPQIYASVVFSTKRDFSSKTLPTASVLIAQLAVKKVISSQVANIFVGIVGQFPLGYGVVYIPKDDQGNELNTYEYAIVTGLNPLKTDQPICRPVSKNLMFMEFSVKETIEKERNLHFHKARKKLEKIDPKRLTEIMQKLSHNFKPEQIEDIVPCSWQPHEYFFVKGNQNLWNQTS